MDDGVVFDHGSARQIATTVRRVLGKRDAMPQRRTKVYWDEQGRSTTSSGGGPCACCNCLECLDLCDVPSNEVVSDCASCPNGAVARYTANVGEWEAYPDLTDGGVITLTYVSGCEWRSANYVAEGGTYRWVLTQAGAATTLALAHVSGDDPVGIGDEYWQIQWNAATDAAGWSCRCHMTMKIASPDKVKEPAGLNCQICLQPYTESTQIPIGCTPVQGTQPCVETIEIGALSFPQGADPTKFPYGYSGDTTSEIDMEWWFGNWCPNGPSGDCYTCVASGGVGLEENDVQDVGFWSLIAYGAGHVLLRFYGRDRGFDDAKYYADPTGLVIGDNTFTFVSNLAPDLVVWPPTINVVLSDCTFGSVNPDYGFGCGGGGLEDCGGSGCRYVAIDSEGTQGGSVGPWTWGGCTGGGNCPDGCELASGAPGTPPSSGSDVYDVLCVPSEGSGGGGSGGASGPGGSVTGETPSGTVDGTNATFTLLNSPIAATVTVYRGGVRQTLGASNDYTLSGTTITFNAGAIPQTGQTVIVDYTRIV